MSTKIDSAKPRLPRPAGSSADVEVSISPRPWLKSVSMLVCRCSKLSTWPARWVARIREVHIGCTRPWRGSSARCHISRTGFFIAWEILAASMAWSPKSLWPNEPPPVITLTLIFDCGRPVALAMSSWATIGDFRPAQTSARSARTSAIAAYGSRAALLRNMKATSISTRLGEHGDLGYGERHLGLAQAGEHGRVGLALDRSLVPDSTSSARIASMHWPKVFARTATPVSTWATSVTPGIAVTSAALRIDCGEPFSVGGRQTMVGSASGTSRSIENFFLPVTMSRASSRLTGLPIFSKPARPLSLTSTSRVVGLAAFSASSP